MMVIMNETNESAELEPLASGHMNGYDDNDYINQLIELMTKVLTTISSDND